MISTFNIKALELYNCVVWSKNIPLWNVDYGYFSQNRNCIVSVWASIKTNVDKCGIKLEQLTIDAFMNRMTKYDVLFQLSMLIVQSMIGSPWDALINKLGNVKIHITLVITRFNNLT